MIVGAVVGGIVVAVATKALPRIMSQMMAQMKAGGHDPADMCQRMMANFKPAQPSEESTAPSQN
jgi:hypothetical protein